MTINIAYLYFDLLNLYGESGNVKALEKTLKNQGIKVNVSRLSLDDKLDFKNYDLVYMGAGTETNQKIALKHLLEYKNEVEEAIKSNKFFFITGNSSELFGKYIEDLTEKKHSGLNIFDYSAKQVTTRLASEVVATAPYLDKEIIAFQNQNSIIENNHDYMFKLLKGIGSYPNSLGDGVKLNNFYATYFIGPVLVRNPHFLTYLVKELITSIDPSFKFKEFKLELEEAAYDNFTKLNYSTLINKNK